MISIVSMEVRDSQEEEGRKVGVESLKWLKISEKQVFKVCSAIVARWAAQILLPYIVGCRRICL